MLRPVIFFAFSNNQDTHLPYLEQEQKDIAEALRPICDEQRVHIETSFSTRIEDVFTLFRHYQNQVVIFHFSGHASGYSLEMKGETAFAEGLADLLGEQKNLQLVFLNGCSTRGQVNGLLQAGIPAVIATQVPIEDDKAAVFASLFYKSLASGKTIEKAFNHASAYLKAKYQQSAWIYRDLLWEGSEEQNSVDSKMPWKLFLQGEEVGKWELPINVKSLDIQKQTSVPLFKYDIPSRPNYFVGRKGKLEELDTRLKAPEGRMPICLVSGVGGMGKTTLVQEYIHTSKCQAYFKRIIHFLVRDEDIKDRLIQVAASALEINVSNYPAPAQLEDKVIHELKKCDGENLFYIDNANSKDQLVEYKYWLENIGWKYIITTRSRPQSYVHETMDIEELGLSDAKMLFLYHYKDMAVDRESYLDALLEHVNKHTLLVELLAKIGRVKALSIMPLFKILDKGNEPLMKALKDNRLDAVVEIGRNSKIRGKLAEGKIYEYIGNLFDLEKLNGDHKTMVRFFSVLPPKDIPLNHIIILFEYLIELWESEDMPDQKLEDSLAYIDQWGWVKHKYHNEPNSSDYERPISYKMHPLIQDVVYEKLPPKFENIEPLIDTLTDVMRRPLSESFVFQPYAREVLDRLEYLVN